MPWCGGTLRAGLMQEFFPLVYDELRRIAARKLRDERMSHTLTANSDASSSHRCDVSPARHRSAALPVQ